MFHEFPEETLYAYPVGRLFGRQALDAVLEAPQRRFWGPFGVYVHVPFCTTICRFCTLVKSDDVRKEVIDRSVEHTLTELTLAANLRGLHGRRVDSIYFGGGTASLLRTEQIARILAHIEDLFSVSGDVEMSFEGECLSLRRGGYVAALREMGFQRISFGVQTMDEGARQVLNLRPSIHQLAELVATCRERFEDQCADFIYGWPGQSVSTAVRDVTRLIEEIDPLSVEAVPFEKLDASPLLVRELADAGVPLVTTAELQAIQQAVWGALREAGFRQERYSYFTKSTLRSRPSYIDCYYGYDEGSVLGAGRGSQSFVDGVMWGSSMEPEAYQARLDAGLLPVSSFATYAPGERESVAWPRRGFTDRRAIARFDDPGYAARLATLEAANLVEWSEDRLDLTDEGRRWIPSVIEHLMPDHQRKSYHRETRRFVIRLETTRVPEVRANGG